MKRPKPIRVSKGKPLSMGGQGKGSRRAPKPLAKLSVPKPAKQMIPPSKRKLGAPKLKPKAMAISKAKPKVRSTRKPPPKPVRRIDWAPIEIALARAADCEGLWCRDVVRFADVLTKYGLPNGIPEHVVRSAEKRNQLWVEQIKSTRYDLLKKKSGPKPIRKLVRSKSKKGKK